MEACYEKGYAADKWISSEYTLTSFVIHWLLSLANLVKDVTTSSMFRLAVFEHHHTHPFLVDKGSDGLLSSSPCSRLQTLNRKLDMRATVITFSFFVFFVLLRYTIASRVAFQFANDCTNGCDTAYNICATTSPWRQLRSGTEALLGSMYHILSSSYELVELTWYV